MLPRSGRFIIVALSAALAVQAADVTHPDSEEAKTPSVDCLAWKPGPSLATIDGTITNQCGKVVTAYTIDAEVFYSDGTNEVHKGAMEEFTPSYSANVGMRFPSGQGPIAVGETREMHKWGIPGDGNKEIVRVEPKVSAIVFEDASAVGAVEPLQQIFRERKLAASELLFWKEFVAVAKPCFVSSKHLTDCLSTPEADARLNSPGNTPEGAAARFQAKYLRQILSNLDSRTDKYTRKEAITYVETFLDTATRSAAHHSQWVGGPQQ